MTKKKVSWLDVIFWLALITIIVWIILKALGFINTLVIVELIPYISGIFIAGIVWQQFRNMQEDLLDIKKRLSRFLRIEHEHNLMMPGKIKHNK